MKSVDFLSMSECTYRAPLWALFFTVSHNAILGNARLSPPIQDSDWWARVVMLARQRCLLHDSKLAASTSLRDSGRSTSVFMVTELLWTLAS